MSSLRRSLRIAERNARNCATASHGDLKHFMKSIYGLRTLDADSSIVLQELIDMLRPLQESVPENAGLMNALRLMYAALSCAEEYDDADGELSDYKYKSLSRLIREHTSAAYELIVANVCEK